MGHGKEDHIRTPELVESLKEQHIVSISLGTAHVLALTNDGKIYGWGKNENKQICESSDMFIQQPRLLEALRNQKVIGISCGPTQSFAWIDINSYAPKTSLPFIIDLSEQTFK